MKCHLASLFILIPCAVLPGCSDQKALAPTVQSASNGTTTDKPGATSEAPARSVFTEGKPMDRYVIADSAEERLAPSSDAATTNRVYRGQAVKVYETKSGWARVSEYYDDRVEGKSNRMARWIKAEALASERPPPPRGLNIPEDPRIPHLTRAPGNGLTERDVLILHAAARYYLETGRAKRVEDGDKSVSKVGVYYLNFGETANTFFRPDDIPDLERRIQGLQR